jgi:ATP-dependent DNA helicase RecQ
MDDNMRNPKKQVEAKENVSVLLKVVKESNQQYKSKALVQILIGKVSALITSHRLNTQPYFGIGKHKDENYWMALIRQVLVSGFLLKDIELYGVIKLSEKGEAFLKNPQSFMMTEDHVYDESDDNLIVSQKGGGVADERLYSLLKEERKRLAHKLNLPPFVIFQDPSLEDMSLKYPSTLEELSNVHGVGEGKAKKYGKTFLELINRYVEENDIIRPDDLVVKSTGSNSALKLYIIQSIDRKLPLPDIADAKGLDMDEFIRELEAIVYSGTKLNIDYWIEEILDEDQQEEIHDYFIEAENDKIDAAMKELDGDYEEEELRLYRIKFISDIAN